MVQHTFNRVMRRSRALRFGGALVVSAVLALTTAPVFSYAQETINAQPLTAQGLALTVQDLGPDWTLSQQNTDSMQGTDIYTAVYGSPSGRRARVETAVASSTELAEGLISWLRYRLESEGLTITSVQSSGFGDGRAFRAAYNDGSHKVVSYFFRVRNLWAFVDYAGASGAGDVDQQATALTRKQEARLFAAFAPPPPAATATPVPATPAPLVVVATPTAAAVPTPAAPLAAAPALPYCGPEERPQFRLGFATLSARLGASMGSPTSCEYSDPRGTGDTLQTTDQGLGVYRQSTNVTTFTDGTDHWALASDGIVHWTGGSVDPPTDAAVLDG